MKGASLVKLAPMKFLVETRELISAWQQLLISHCT